MPTPPGTAPPAKFLRLAALALLTLAVLTVGRDVAEAIETQGLPAGFVYLSAVAPTILQDIRYAGRHNFVGRPIRGYDAAECVLTSEAAQALVKVQADLAQRKLTLIVWDCYRPVRAVDDFKAWSRDTTDTKMQAEFYPRTDKLRLFTLGYLASHSAQSRGSTVDLGIASAGSSVPRYDAHSPLTACFARRGVRYDDGTIDLGTGYDCLDVLGSTTARGVSSEAINNRALLKGLMESYGFKAYSREWWHFELVNEPFPTKSFNFSISSRNPAHQK